ncbi:MAG: oligosaccharide flippase family protein [Candidatus Omnitrophica bacterium]|nr:oligosaccharide flippase family protein [Candidatus Omnitrophota bacterium]
MQRRQVLINAVMSVVQTVVISGVLFILYRFFLKTIGVEQLGIWSLVLATTSITQIANLGLSGSVVKFVAKYVARGEEENVCSVIQTAAISVSVFIGIILLFGYPVMKWILKNIIPLESIRLAIEILPFAIFSLWITMIVGVFHSGFDGYQRIYIRNLLLMSGAIFYLVLCFIFVPLYGLIGLAYAQIIQNVIILFSTWILLKRYLPMLPFIPYKWDKNLFREMISYGINFQMISVTVMFYDPITKALLSKFGGLSMVGYYEMANKMIIQLRALIVSANQVLVPAIADLKEKIPEKIQSVYLTSYQLLFYLAVPLYSLIIVSIPIISKLWIGRYESVFVDFGTLLTIGWFLNVLNAPAYFANLGIGELRWNVISHVTIGVLNAGLGFLLGVYFGGTGVVVAWVVALALGSSLIYLSYHIRNKIPLIELLPKASRATTIACLLGILFSILIQYKFNHIFNTIVLNSLIIFIFSTIIFFPFWLHPMRKRLMGWITHELLNGGMRS